LPLVRVKKKGKKGGERTCHLLRGWDKARRAQQGPVVKDGKPCNWSRNKTLKQKGLLCQPLHLDPSQVGGGQSQKKEIAIDGRVKKRENDVRGTEKNKSSGLS